MLTASVTASDEAGPRRRGVLALPRTPPPRSHRCRRSFLIAKPAVALVTARVNAEVTMNCGSGPVTVKPSPFVETGTGWFVDGRGCLITNAHVVDPAYRQPPWVAHELKKKAIDQACVEPAPEGARARARSAARRRGRDPPRGERRALASAKVEVTPQLTVLLSERRQACPPRSRSSAHRSARHERQAHARLRDATSPCCA